MVYQYDKDLESSYRNSMMKNLKKTCTEGLFNVVLFDSINDKVNYFQEGYYHAEAQGFVVSFSCKKYCQRINFV